jgi:hypothetical protein
MLANPPGTLERRYGEDSDGEGNQRKMERDPDHRVGKAVSEKCEGADVGRWSGAEHQAAPGLRKSGASILM